LFEVEFYEDRSGFEPVKELILELQNKAVHHKIMKGGQKCRTPTTKQKGLKKSNPNDKTKEAQTYREIDLGRMKDL